MKSRETFVRLGIVARGLVAKLTVMGEELEGNAREGEHSPSNGYEIDVADGPALGEGIGADRLEEKAGVEAGEVAHGLGSGDGRKIAIRAGLNWNGRVWAVGLATP